jgi:hypothetical protein
MERIRLHDGHFPHTRHAQIARRASLSQGTELVISEKHDPRVPFPHEGRFAIVTDVGSGMRWTSQHQAGAIAPRECGFTSAV